MRNIPVSGTQYYAKGHVVTGRAAFVTYSCGYSETLVNRANESQVSETAALIATNNEV